MVMMRQLKPENRSTADGFTLVEVLISMMVTLIVMSAVFGLLSRGQSTFQREPEIADMQQTARSALDMVSRDALQAGAGLPPEFPAFTPNTLDPDVGDGGANPDVIQIIGGLGGSMDQSAGPEEVDPTSFSGDLSSSTFLTAGERTSLAVGDLVVLYSDNNMGLNGYWIMSYVQDIELIAGLPNQMEISLAPTPPDPGDGGEVPEEYQARTATLPVPFSPVLVTPVTVVRYFTQPDATMTPSGTPVNALMRQVNFGQPSPVAYLEDFQVVYLVGGTTAADELDDPPDPQPDPGLIIQAADVINGVSITVAARSLSEDQQGATEGVAGNFIRKSFSSNVNPRNIIAGLAERCFQETGQQCWQ